MEYPTSCGLNVFANRPTPFWLPELPAICIYMVTEEATVLCQPIVYERKPKIIIDILGSISATDLIDDYLDSIALEVENILFANQDNLYDPEVEDPTPENDRNIDGQLIYTGCEMNIFQINSMTVGSLKLMFDTVYHTESPTPETDIAEFVSGKANYEINNDTVPDAVDVVQLRS
jgi:hypothetical protein